MAKTFVTIFPYAVNSHLIKDLGQIPHFLNQQHRQFDRSRKAIQNVKPPQSQNCYYTISLIYQYLVLKLLHDVNH